ncbi:MAG TPA: nucleoside deaminase [Chthoniobacterales bacterium]
MNGSLDDVAAHRRWMDEAIALARAGMREHGGGPFGAVVVTDGKIVGRGWNQVTRLLDPTAHAEVTAIRDACRALQRFELRDCVLYTSCEPCPMCLAAIYWARLDQIYYASTRHDAATIGFDDDFIYQQIPLDLAARSLPMIQLPTPAAATLFSDWSANPDKIPY